MKKTAVKLSVIEANQLENNNWISPLIEQGKEMNKIKNNSEYMNGWHNGFNSQEIENLKKQQYGRYSKMCRQKL